MTVRDFLNKTAHLPTDAKIYTDWDDEDAICMFLLGIIRGRAAVNIYCFDDSKKAYIDSGYNVVKAQYTIGDIRDKWSSRALDYPLNLHLNGGYTYVVRELSKVLISTNNDIVLLCK